MTSLKYIEEDIKNELTKEKKTWCSIYLLHTKLIDRDKFAYFYGSTLDGLLCKYINVTLEAHWKEHQDEVVLELLQKYLDPETYTDMSTYETPHLKSRISGEFIELLESPTFANLPETRWVPCYCKPGEYVLLKVCRAGLVKSTEYMLGVLGVSINEDLLCHSLDTKISRETLVMARETLRRRRVKPG